MFTLPYGLLQQYGFSHPLHPTLTHLPIGLVLGAFCFLLISMLFRISSLRQTASHCLVLAAITLPLAAGQPKGCVTCHKAVKGNDWIFTEPK